MTLLPFGGNSVMASRSLEQLNENDYFPTQPWGGRSGAEILRMLDPRARSGCDPGCGEGHLRFGFAPYFTETFGSDIVDYGQPDLQDAVGDFLADDWTERVAGGREFDWFIGNPPFIDGEAFIRTAWARALRGVAMLLRLQFTEGGGRHALFTRDCPLALTATYSERLPMFVGRYDPGRSSTTAYRWFFFLKPEAEAQSPFAGAIAAARELGCSLERLIGPGTRARLEKPEDLTRFGPLSVLACRRMADELQALGGEKNLAKAKELRGDADRIERLLAANRDPLFGDGGLA